MKTRTKIIIAAAGTVAVVAVAALAAGSSTDPATVTPAAAPAAVPAPTATAPTAAQAPAVDHAADIRITGCEPDEAGWAAAEITITNNSSKASNYLVQVTFDTADHTTQIGTGYASVDNLAPGQKAVQTASALKDAQPGYLCTVTDVTRYAA